MSPASLERARDRQVSPWRAGFCSTSSTGVFGKSSLREVSSPFPFPLVQAARRGCGVSILRGIPTQLDMAQLFRGVLSSLLQLTLLRAGGWSGRSPEVPASLGRPVNPRASSEVTGPVPAPGLGLAQPAVVGAGPAPAGAKAPGQDFSCAHRGGGQLGPFRGAEEHFPLALLFLSRAGGRLRHLLRPLTCSCVFSFWPFAKEQGEENASQARWAGAGRCGDRH